MFSSSNGGWSVPGGLPYLTAKADPWDGATPNPMHTWAATLPVSTLEARYPAVGRLLRLTVTARDGDGQWGGRIKTVVLEGVDSSGRATSVTTTGDSLTLARPFGSYADGPAQRLVDHRQRRGLSASFRRSPTLGADRRFAACRAAHGGGKRCAMCATIGGVHLAVVAEQLRAPVPGGTGRYTRELLAALTRVSPGDRIQAWCAPPAACPHVLERVRRPLLAELWRRGAGPAPRRAEVVFAPTPLAPPRRGRPLVVTLHDAVPWSAPQTLTPHGARWHRDIGARIAADADVVVTPTEAAAAELRRHLPLRRVEVIGEGVSAAVAEVPADARLRARRLGLPDAYALVVGTLEPRKGLDVAAAALVDPAWPGLPLLIVGPKGWGDAEAPTGARLLGRLPDADLATAYARATVLLMPSREEGFGLPVIEAMAHGTPAVISDAPALVEVAGGAAIVTARGDAPDLAAGAARAVAEREQWAAAGRLRSASFSWESAARKLRENLS